jgi:hypothetical protein
MEIFILCHRSARTALLLDGQTTGGASTGPGTRLYTAHEWFSLAVRDATLSLDQKGELQFD